MRAVNTLSGVGGGGGEKKVKVQFFGEHKLTSEHFLADLF